MTMLRTDVLPLVLSSLVVSACGTKYVADLDTEAQQGSGSATGDSGDDEGSTAGHTGAQSTTVATSDAESTGEVPGDCEPEPSCFGGGDVATTYFTLLRDPSDGPVDDVADDVAFVGSEYDEFGEFWRLSFASESVTWEITAPLPDATADRFVVDAVYQVRWVVADQYTEVLSITADDGTLEVLTQSGASVDDFGTPSAYAGFTIGALDDVCEPQCVPAEVCWGQDQQRLVFGLGEDEVEVWDHARGTLGDYAIAVGQATGVEQVHPDVPACEIENLPVYNFLVANVAPL